MLGITVLAAFAALAILQRQTFTEVVADLPSKLSDKLDKLWVIAQEALKDRKYLRAEKALLMILRIDERNATAYNRLGILYAKQQEFKDAIECFEIAQSLEPSASSLHNVGLIYYETEQYDKAALAFEQALKMEEDVASRHVAYAKIQEKLDQPQKAIVSLERAVALEPKNTQALTILADALERTNQPEKANEVRQKVVQIAAASQAPTNRIKQPRRAAL